MSFSLADSFHRMLLLYQRFVDHAPRRVRVLAQSTHQVPMKLQNIDPVNEGTVYPCLCCLPVPLHKDDPCFDMTAGTVQVAIKRPEGHP